MFCKACHTEKPALAFYASNPTRCKECVKASARANRLEKIDYYRSYDRMRASMPHRVAARAEYMLTPEGKAARRRAHDSHNAKKRNDRPSRKDRPAMSSELLARRAKARIALGNAVRDGKLIAWPVCAVPDCCKRAEAHHPDYSAPLAVAWLCRAHHRQAHALVANSSDMKEAA